MKMSWTSRVCGYAVLFLLVSTAANAQWVMVGRKVVGKVSSLVQPRDAKNPGYGAATVILEADAGKVYATAVDLLLKNPKMSLTKKDDAKRTISFTQGDWAVQVQVSELGDGVCQLLIVSGAGPGETGGTDVVVDAVKRICNQMGVKYVLE